MNINIPFPFAAHTQLHSELIDFSLPPAANKIYYWLLSRQKAGEEQEFDKADFDRFCGDRGRNPFSIYWFSQSLKKLFGTKLVKLVRKYCGYGYKVVVYHPWQVDDWLLESRENTTKNCNKSWNKSNKSCKKPTPNTDSSVPIYRENREKTAIHTESKKKNTTGELQNLIAAKKNEYQISEVVSKKSGLLQKSKIKPEKPKICSITNEDNSPVAKEDLNVNSNQNNQDDPRDKFFRKEDVDVFDNFLNDLNDFGIHINQTVQRYLAKYIKQGKKGKIETALKLFRSRKRDRVIAEPAAYFIQLLKENISDEKAGYKVSSSDISDRDNRSDFNHWLELAKENGCCSGYEIVDDKIIVNMNGTKELWESAFNRGYNFEYFQTLLKRK